MQVTIIHPDLLSNVFLGFLISYVYLCFTLTFPNKPTSDIHLLPKVAILDLEADMTSLELCGASVKGRYNSGLRVSLAGHFFFGLEKNVR